MRTITLPSAINAPRHAGRTIPGPRKAQPLLNADEAMQLAEHRPGKVPAGLRPVEPRPYRASSYAKLKEMQAQHKHLAGHPCGIRREGEPQCSIGLFGNLLANSPHLCCAQCELQYKRITSKAK